MNKNILIGAIFTVAIIGVIIFFVNQKPQGENSGAPTQAQNTNEGKIIEGYSGKILAGNSSPYIIFNKNDYKKALADNKIIFLDFYANWCPICREEAPELRSGFDNLTTDEVVGFRINYNDTETDEDEKKLASEFKIPYQHTKVIIKNGKEILRSLESWDKETFLKEINSL